MTPSGTNAPRNAILWLIASILLWTGRASAQDCTGGREASDDTNWHCCWPGQSWGPQERACVGPPICPAGLVMHGESCVAPLGASSARAQLTPSPPLVIEPPHIEASPTESVDIREVPVGAPDWPSSPQSPTADLNPRLVDEPTDPGLLAAGLATLLAGYVTNAVAAAPFLSSPGILTAWDLDGSSERRDRTCHDVVGGLELVPVVGALGALIALATCTVPTYTVVRSSGGAVLGYERTGDSPVYDTGAWPVVMVAGAAVQVLGFGLTLGGALGSHRSLQVGPSSGSTLTVRASAPSADVGLSLGLVF